MIAENITFNFVPITEENFEHLCQLPAARQWIEGNFTNESFKFNLGYHCAQSEDRKIILYPLLGHRMWFDTKFILIYGEFVCVFIFDSERPYFPFYEIIYWSDNVSSKLIKEKMIAIAEYIIRKGGESLNGNLNPNNSINDINEIEFSERLKGE